MPRRLAAENLAGLSWQQKVRRVGQTNMTEHDPAVMNIEEWADYWHSVPPVSHTDEPAVVLRETRSSRIAFFPGDIERTYWLTGHGDLLRLMHNTICWLTRDQRIIHIEGDGFIESSSGKPLPVTPSTCSTTPSPTRTTAGCKPFTRSAHRPSA